MPYGSKFPSSKPIEINFFDSINPENYSIDEIVTKTRNTIKDWLDAK